jgi:hypothetical protein
MGRQTVEYSEKELNRPSKYIVAICDPSVDTSIIDMEEADNYVNKFNRRAIIISSKESFKKSDLELTKYIFIVNATKPAVRLIDPNGESYKKVYEFIVKKFLNGLIIAHADTVTNHIADELSTLTGKGLDFIIYRQNLMELTMNERSKMNYLRIHYNPDFIFSKDMFTNYVEKFGNQTAIGIFLTQYIVNTQQSIARSYFEDQSKIFEDQGLEDFVDYYQMNRQFAYYLYYDLRAGKVIGMSADKLQEYMEYMFKAIDNKPLANKSNELSQMFAS